MPNFVQIIEDDERLSYQPPGFDATFELRRLHPDAIDRIERKHRKIERNSTGIPVAYIPAAHRMAYNLDLWDYMICDWTGVMDGKNQPVPCTRDTKGRLPRRIRDLLLEVADVSNLTELRDGESAPATEEANGRPPMA